MQPARDRRHTEGGKGEVSIRVRLADGRVTALEGSPGRIAVTGGSSAPPTLFLPAEDRVGAMLAAWTPRRGGSAAKVFERALAQPAPTQRPAQPRNSPP